MRKRLIIILAVVFVLFAFFQWYIICLYAEDISLAGYFSGIFADISQTISGNQSDKLIRMNLYNYSIFLYESGQLIKPAKISAAGNPNFSPTPVGTFQILSKEIRHISGISGLVMPLSLRFYKGYYLHALPTYRSGKPFTSTYSAGCIRLNNDLAPEIFNWADIGTKVEIYNSFLVKSADALTVYYLNQDGTKEPISSAEEFVGRGFRWQDIKTIPLAELNTLPMEGTAAVKI